MSTSNLVFALLALAIIACAAGIGWRRSLAPDAHDDDRGP